MKRYIRCTEDMQVFEMSTDTSYYDNFLNDKDLKYMQDAKNRTGKIRYLSPREYYKECADNIFHVDVNSLMDQRRSNGELIQQYIADMEKGDLFPLCFLNYAESGQEGLHRMMAAGEAFGWDKKYPVLCVYVYDEEVENRHKKWEDMHDFERYYLEDICDDVANEISDWYGPVPDDVCEQFRNKIEDLALDRRGVTIQVITEINDVDGHLRLECYLEYYEGLENYNPSNKSNNWLEDMYDMKPSESGNDEEMDIDEWMFLNDLG